MTNIYPLDSQSHYLCPSYVFATWRYTWKTKPLVDCSTMSFHRFFSLTYRCVLRQPVFFSVDTGGAWLYVRRCEFSLGWVNCLIICWNGTSSSSPRSVILHHASSPLTAAHRRVHAPILHLVTVFSCIPSQIHSYKFLFFLTPCTKYDLRRKNPYCHFERKQGIRSKAAMAAPMQVDEAVPGDSSKLKPYTSSDAC